MNPAGSAPTRARAPHQPTPAQRWAARFIGLATRANQLTHRLVLRDAGGAFEVMRRKPAIFALWHNRLAILISARPRVARELHIDRGMAGLVSASRDGALLAAVMEEFGVHPVRGSTSRRGPQALLELQTCAESGYDLAITPDGPRGPRYRVQSGVVALARLTGRPIIPASCNSRWKISLKSWDRFQIPLPGGRWEIVFGTPLHLTDTTDTALEQTRQALEHALTALTRD